MTSLVAWVGVDSRGPASIYLVSDSRISWGSGQVWDYGRKLFTSTKYPDILGYYGDVLFPSQALGRVIDFIDADLLLDTGDLPRVRHEKIATVIKSSLKDYPLNQVTAKTFTIVYCTRENEGMAANFHLSSLKWSSADGWREEWLPIPSKSGIIRSFGSGEKPFAKWYSRWNNTKEGRTSRSVFSAFCDALHSSEDKLSGGAPQLVGIYRKDIGKTFGIIYNNERYIFGLPVTESDKLQTLEWRNSLFERCDWHTKEPLQDVQRHKRPRGLGNTL
ncbi:MAG: hypothetical protein L0331_15855 [Chloroflexi bacterium]|nr:hypothetical protein [Chloroflexota bacterium]MCI0644878.1 hypothetical protein [Chloroflexota bacterium]